MTARIGDAPNMDVHEFIDDGYPRLDHMDGLGHQPDEYALYGGLKPGMVVTDTRLPFYPPEPVPAWSDLSWRERIDSIKPGLAVTGALILFVVVVGLGAAWIAGLI